MKKATLRLFVLFTVVAAGGCGDNWPKLMQNELTLKHELNDALMKVVDEDSAKFYKEFYFKKLKTTWEDIQKRKDVYIKVHVTSKQALDEFVKDLQLAMGPGRELGDAFRAVEQQWQRDENKRNQLNKLLKEKSLLDEFAFIALKRYRDELAAANRRRAEQLGRIRAIAFQLEREGAETSNLQGVVSEASGMLGGTQQQ